MKHAPNAVRSLRFKLAGKFRCVLLLCSCAGIALVGTPPVLALNEDNPYNPIISRNAFALKDPPLVLPTVLQPPTPPANIELRGITTLLGRPQVLLNFKVAGKPPEPPKDRSLVMDVGQREGEVEVLEIDPASGSVRLRNQGNELALNLKDNSPKPQFSASAAAPGLAPPGLPPPLPSMPAAAPAANPSPTTIGAPSKSSLPTRNLRSGSSTQIQGQSGAIEQAAMMEIERERTKTLVQQGKMPPLPPMPYSHADNTGAAPQ